MTRIVDPLDNQEINLQDDEELISPFDQSDNSKKEFFEEPEQEKEVDEANDLPEKYKGKTVADLARMHQEAEKLLGRQGSEVGELRKAVDDLLKKKIDEVSGGDKVEDQEEDFDFYENPKDAVNRTLEKSETIQEMKKMLAKQQQAEALSQLESKHPNFMEVVQNQDFIKWVERSKVRIELLQRADKYDLDAAVELLDNWKDIKHTVETANSVSEQDRKLQRKAASTGGRGSSEPVSRKIYRRTDLVNLMRTDPKKYMANVAEFDKAYAEGRVK